MKSPFFLLLSIMVLTLQAGCHRPDPNGPAAVVRKFFALVREGKMDEAAWLLYPDKITRDPARFRRIKNALAPHTNTMTDLGGFTEEILDEKITGDSAIVIFQGRYGDGLHAEKATTWNFIKDRGLWKVVGDGW